ncbi:MAG TPA: hypothetical protein VNT99_10970 [Methylomirabilota bacterium]|nr:hypothetical protein [Methylomirabilota bacterium]
MKLLFTRIGMARSIIAGLVALLSVVPWCLAAAQTSSADKSDAKEQTASGSFVSFRDGRLTLKGKTGPLVFEQVGANYRTFEDNENGPGSKLVDTVAALSHVEPGAVFQVNVAAREIRFGLDYRVIGTFESYRDGKLNLRAADVPPGFVQKPASNVLLTIDPIIPVLESINGGDYKHAGPAGTFLPKVKQGTQLTARSEYDPDIVEVIQIGRPKRGIERYGGQTRATVRGTFVAFKGGVLRLQAKGITPLAANEYDRLINLRIPGHVPIVESIDGEAYQPASVEALKTAREGTIVTVRKVEEVILEVQIGVARAR